MGIHNFFFAPRSWQDEKLFSLFLHRVQNLPFLLFQKSSFVSEFIYKNPTILYQIVWLYFLTPVVVASALCIWETRPFFLVKHKCSIPARTQTGAFFASPVKSTQCFASDGWIWAFWITHWRWNIKRVSAIASPQNLEALFQCKSDETLTYQSQA